MTESKPWVEQHRPARPAAHIDTSPVVFQNGHRPKRAVAYVERAFKAEILDLANTSGGRNQKLNDVAHRLGRFVGAGMLDMPDVRDSLYGAAVRNGYVAKDGELATLSTIASGIRSGIADPWQMPPDRPDWISEDEWNAARESANRQDPKPAVTSDGRSRTQSDAIDDDESPAAPSSWLPENLDAVLDGTYEPELPAFMARVDGVRLLYAGRVHSFHGESESGKSLVAQIVCASVLIAGGRALYLDFESDAATVVGRLLLMGVPKDAIRERFAYVRPDASPMNNDNIEAYAQLFRQPFDVAIIDGVTEAMGVFGVESSNNNDQIAMWIRRFPRKLAADTGAAVVLIDHVAKDTETRGRFAIGGQHKLAGLDGAAYSFEVRKALGRGLRGGISMRIVKDRVGSIRPHCGEFRVKDRTQEAAYIVIDSTGDDGAIRFEVRSPSVGEEQYAVHMRAISEYLEKQQGRPASQRNITDAVDGRAEDVRHAINKLGERGHIKIEKTGRGFDHTFIKPYPSPDGSGDETDNDDD